MNRNYPPDLIRRGKGGAERMDSLIIQHHPQTGGTTRTVPLLSSFFQIGYVTKDLDAGMRQLGGIHGIAGFFPQARYLYAVSRS